MNSETPWMDWLNKHIGEHEVKGSQDNPFIMSLYKYGNYPVQHDEVPWCACAANAALIVSGYKGTHSASASSFDHCGIPCEPKYGAMIRIRHASGHGHITFFVKWVDEQNKIAECLGGNQADSIKISTYNLSGNIHGHDQIAACRWPELEPLKVA